MLKTSKSIFIKLWNYRFKIFENVKNTTGNSLKIFLFPIKREKNIFEVLRPPVIYNCYIARICTHKIFNFNKLFS